MTIENRVRQVVDEYVVRVRQALDTHVESLTGTLAALVAEQAALRDQQTAEHQSRLEQLVAEHASLREEQAAAHQSRLAQLEDSVAEEKASQARQSVEHQSRLEQLLSEQRALQEQLVAEQNTGQEHQAAAELARRESLAAVQQAAGARKETLERLTGAVRRIDASDGLNGILGALAQAAVDYTPRVAILLVDGHMFRTWGHFGFESGSEPAEIPIGAAGTLATAVAIRQTSVVSCAHEEQAAAEPAFMRLSAGSTGVVVPLTVGGDVVAVLYADDMTRVAGQAEASSWTEEVELLTRHAAVRLENVTSARAVEALARPD